MNKKTKLIFLRGVRNVKFNKIASILIQCNAEDDGTIPKATIDEIAETSGTTDRRVCTVLKALEAEGWRPLKGYSGRTNDLF